MKRILSHIAILVLLVCAVRQLSAQTFPSIQQEIRLFNTASSQYIGLLSPSNLGSTYSLTLPGNQGANGQVMVNNGSGVLSWTTPLTSSSGWALIGNSGTSIAVNFLGTTDNVPLAIRTSNTERLRVTADGLVLIGSTSGTNTLNVTGTLGVTGLITGSGGATLTGTTQINTTGTSATTIGSTTASVTIGSVSGAVKSSVGSNDRIVLASSTGALDQASISSVVAAGISSSAWALTGNTGTNASTSYIGTTDPVDLVFRTAGTERMRIVNTSGQLSTSNDATINGVRIGRGNSAVATNTAVGRTALMSNTTGNSNTAIGDSVLSTNTTGYFNTASGIASLHSNTTGHSNSAFGAWSTFSNTQGYSNTAIGVSSMYSNTTGYWNTASGGTAMYSNTTGIANTADGHGALYSNQTGNYNIAIGAIALQFSKTGSSNAALGYLAGSYIADGTTINETVNNSIFIGASTKALANNQSNQIVIGFNAVGLGSNTVVLGNTDIVTTALQGNVLINNSGANNPGALRFYEGTTSGTNFIGMRAPTTLASDFTYTLPTTAPTAGQVLSSAADGTMSWATALTSSSGWSLTGNSSIDSTINYIGTTDEAVGRPLIIRTDGSERMRVLGGSGFVGIGTNNPTAQLQVNPVLPGTTALQIRAASGQTANLITVANSAGTSVFQVGASGNVIVGPNAADVQSLDEPLKVGTRVSATGAEEKDVFIAQAAHASAAVPSMRLGLSNYNTAAGGARTQLNIKLRRGSDGVETTTSIMSLRSEGFVGINHAVPSAILSIRPSSSSATSNLLVIASTAGTDLLTVGTSGALTLLPFASSAGSTNELRFTELSGGGTDYVGFKAPDAIASNRIWTLPSADGTSGQVLTTNGSGMLSWASALTPTSGWSTTGNSGLNESTNFLGTLDPTDIVFRRQNVEKLRVTSAGIRVVQNGTPVASQWVASFQNIGNPTYLELLNSSDGGGMYMGMRGNGNIGDTATIWNWQGGPLGLYTGPGNKGSFLRMMITSDGNVAIGGHATTFNTSARLHVRGGNVLIDTINTGSGTVSGQLLFRNQAGTFNTSIRAGNQTADIAYWLPAVGPSANGQVLTSNTAGVMSWADMGSQAWSVLGNSGTSQNFIGTTNPVDLVLKRDDTERARITSAGLRVVQNGAPRISAWTLSVQNITSTNGSTVVEFLNTTAAVDGGGGFVGLKGTGVIGDTLGLWNHQAGPIIFSTSSTNRSDNPRVRIGANGNVAIGNTTAGTLLDVDGGVTVRPGTTTNVTADNQAITIGNRSHVVLNSNGAPGDRTVTISNGLQTGQILFILVTAAGTNGIEIVDDPTGSNTNLSGPVQLLDGDLLQLIWNGVDWIEVSRRDN